ncbi:SPOR domain-containing protein [Teredinibacter waterburyi]|uniref:SPOR domain-containing protein n=1 Tax=Teredinibacter waterburyi TaxID=1500538 RepID=UPI00165FF08C|nr:SPOR domain-containing protein [Teredinibacter waterburyi]
MAQDYARKRRPTASRKKNEARVPAWVWLFTGCVVGGFIMFLMRLSSLDPVQAITNGAEPTQASSEPLIKKPQLPQLPRFDFYELLKENEVAVPEKSLAAQKALQNDTAQPSNQEYILQVASFRGLDDAESLRVQLLLLNLNAQVEEARVRNGEKWHRVLVGPFTSRSELAKARATLVSNSHQALVLKRALPE